MRKRSRNKALLKSAKSTDSSVSGYSSGDDANDGIDKTKAVRTFARLMNWPEKAAPIVICGESCAIETLVIAR